MKKILLNIAIAVLLAVNVINMIADKVTVLNAMAVVVCLIVLALNFVDRMHND